jgi:phosphatidylglycerophosphate synthase
MKFEWNLPNALTLLRIALVPAIGACLIADTALSLFIGLVLFGVSALTDALDGAIARKLNLESEFGGIWTRSG